MSAGFPLFFLQAVRAIIHAADKLEKTSRHRKYLYSEGN
jgi:hypothetical protein